MTAQVMPFNEKFPALRRPLQHAALHFGRTEDAFGRGLHEYLTDFLKNTAVLGREIRETYLSRRDKLLNR